ncbi:MAG: spore cortex biosynthesis protein YabQ [Oscillospiraceae bacterium]|jgi:spore cortex biosynthesis protein YabQ
MELPVSLQMMQAITSVAAGIGLGLVYDLFRIVRKQCSGQVVPQLLDLLFSAIVLSVLFYVMQHVGGGAFRLFMILAAALGAVLYFAGPSVWICRGLEKVADGMRWVLRLLTKPLKLLEKPCKKILKFLKNLFQKPIKWSKIHCINRNVTKHVGDPAQQEGDAVEPKAGSYIYKDYRNCHSHVRGCGVDGSTRTGPKG